MDEVTRMVALSGDRVHFPLVMALLAGDARPDEILFSLGARLIIEPDRNLDGKMLNSLLVDRGTAQNLRLLVDPDTKLVRKIQQFYPFSPSDLARMDKEEPPRRVVIDSSWSASSIQLGAAAADLFSYQPPRDLTRVGNFKRAALLAEAMFYQPLAALLGSPAPDFTLNVVNNTGSSRKVSKSDLACVAGSRGKEGRAWQVPCLHGRRRSPGSDFRAPPGGRAPGHRPARS